MKKYLTSTKLFQFDIVDGSIEQSLAATLRAETFVNRNFHDFRNFWSFSRKFMSCNILKHEVLKIFCRENTNSNNRNQVNLIKWKQFARR